MSKTDACTRCGRGGHTASSCKRPTGLAYYNEIDPYVAEWLRNLIDAGHIARGVVDTRSIEDVRPDDLRGFTQCHFFAGVGVWSYALRRAGWPDDRPVWTGSCPCQPFSSAGQVAGFADERHLWPAFHHLIKECKPAIVFGEQVASKDADTWIDLVHTDMEALGYAFGAVPFPSASIGAPHIRDRLYWVADSDGKQYDRARRFWQGGRAEHPDGCATGRVGNTYRIGAGRDGGSVCGPLHREDGQHLAHDVDASSAIGGLADNELQQRQDGQPGISIVDASGGRIKSAAAFAGLCGDLRPGPTNGHWRDADWLFCRDGKWRAVEPGTFPLAHGASARVGRLRAYGNGLCAPAAQAFIEAVGVAA